MKITIFMICSLLHLHEYYYFSLNEAPFFVVDLDYVDICFQHMIQEIFIWSSSSVNKIFNIYVCKLS